MTTARRVMADAITEAELLESIRTLARQTGWLTFHPHRSDRSEPGWPDLVLVRGRIAYFVELKAMRGRPTREQNAWLDALGGVTDVRTALWRPSEWLSGAIDEALL